MTRFSASDAALEGVNVIRRHWRVVAGWAGFNLLALVMMVVLTVMVLLVLTVAGGGGATASPSATSGVIGGLVALVGTLLAQVILVSGLYRLLLRPEQPAFLYLRLGRDELRLLGVWGIWLLILFVLGGLAGALGSAAGPRLALLIAAVALVAAVYLTLRFALAAPISFAEGRIDFAASWRLTRGRTAALLGMFALMLSLVFLIAVLASVIMTFIALAAGGFEGVAAISGGADALENHPGIYLLNTIGEILMLPVIWVLLQAPLAAAYMALTRPDIDA